APDAAGARRSWRTGRYHFPTLEAVETSGDTPDMLELLRQHGVSTHLIIDGSRPHDAEFARGWDHIKIATGDKKETAFVRTLEAVQKALGRCARREHWLIWVELAPLRPPWDVPPEFRDRYFEEAEDDAEDAPLQPWTEPLPERTEPGDD